MEIKEHRSINRSQKERLNGHPAFVLWLTGLSAAGKTTIARQLEQELFTKNIRTIILDGDITRKGINKDLDFSPEGRKENIRRIAEISRLMNEAGVVVIASLISPFEEDRKLAGEIIGKEHFIEIFVDAPVEVCRRRDPKGLYLMAYQGKISDFTGVGSPYECPSDPDIHLHTHTESVEQSTRKILDFLKNKNLY